MVIDKSFNKKALEPDKLITFKLPESAYQLPKELIKEIIGYIYSEYMAAQSPFEPFSFSEFFASICWNTDTTHGSLNKRIQKWLYENYKFKFTDKISNQVGALIKKATFTPRTFYLDFTKNLQWKAGEFGDFDSCFFNSNIAAKNHMEKSPNFIATRFFRPVPASMSYGKPYHKDDSSNLVYTGAGRAWIYMPEIEFPLNSETTIKGKGLVLFNARGYPLHEIVMTLGQYFQLPYKEIKISNNKQVTGTLYIDTVAYLIADKTILERVDSLDLEQPVE